VTSFGIWQLFARDGKPTWYVLPTGSWLDLTYRTTIYQPRATKWLGSTFNPASLQMTPIGEATFQFSELSISGPTTNAARMTMSYQLTAGEYSGSSSLVSMSRKPF
jgi:hypothetical protein